MHGEKPQLPQRTSKGKDLEDPRPSSQKEPARATIWYDDEQFHQQRLDTRQHVSDMRDKITAFADWMGQLLHSNTQTKTEDMVRTSEQLSCIGQLLEDLAAALYSRRDLFYFEGAVEDIKVLALALVDTFARSEQLGRNFVHDKYNRHASNCRLFKKIFQDFEDGHNGEKLYSRLKTYRISLINILGDFYPDRFLDYSGFYERSVTVTDMTLDEGGNEGRLRDSRERKTAAARTLECVEKILK
jgi:hypothetical protein